MSKMITGSLNLSNILEFAKQKHSAFSRAANGHVYVNIIVWQNDEPDKFGNHFSVQLNPKKDAPEDEKKKYIGNMKFMEKSEPAPLNDETAAAIPDDSDLPF